MKQPHPISSNEIIQLIHSYYGLHAQSITFIPLGDKSFSYNIRCQNGDTFYLKLLDKKTQEEAIKQTEYYLPLLTELHEKSLFPSAIYPILTKDKRNKIEFDDIVFILFPWIDGPTLADSYPLEESYIRQIAKLLAALHTTTTIIGNNIYLPTETFNADFLNELHTYVMTLQQRSTPLELIDIITPKQKEIISLIEQVKELSKSFKYNQFPLVICHGDLWGGNLIQSPAGLRVIDWESVILAPMERELVGYITQMPFVFIKAYEEEFGTRIIPNIDLLRFFSYRTQLHNLYSWLKNILIYQLDEDQQMNDIEMIKYHCLNRWDGIEEALRKLEIHFMKKVGE
ncbi:aminoglycoside phosphotransferase family protein [Bacillus sp. FJAT-49732]|uniref:Aminoglycoside phosphotransferase family protein n=1 Tax=Lederbergia citrisecunda TaxID=2833583 RepID=A0A942TQ45_9BACI|nr:phosphotransferase [Lederbergia citrisecunda]MBS4200836.1 aminoglycoside phosphotransferase family protein [Lederbergia citrisecunda]